MLDSIGTAHLDKEFQSTVLTSVKKHADIMVEKTGVEASMTYNDIKEYIEMVTNEVHKSRL